MVGKRMSRVQGNTPTAQKLLQKSCRTWRHFCVRNVSRSLRSHVGSNRETDVQMWQQMKAVNLSGKYTVPWSSL